MPANLLGNRLGTFVRLAEQTRGTLGRTQLMKLCYFLQAFRGVPLGYYFTLYAYGPFDSDVLADLQTAESMDVLHSAVEYYPGGYKYDIQPGEKAGEAKSFANDFLATHRRDIEWVAARFGSRLAADLELLSTIAFVNLEEGVSSRDELVERVKLVKPHFSRRQIGKEFDWLSSEKLLS